MASRNRSPLVKSVRIDTVGGVIEHGLHTLQQASEAQRYEILRALISDLSEPAILASCFNDTTLDRCIQVFKKSERPAVSGLIEALKCQRTNIRKMRKTLMRVQDPAVPLERLVFERTCPDTHRKVRYLCRSLPFTDRHRLQIERERQTRIGWEGLLTFIRNLFERLPTQNEAIPLGALAEGTIWELRRHERDEQWLWGLFLQDDKGVAERVTLSLFAGGTGDVTLFATRIDDTEEGEKLRFSIDQAKWAAAHYVQRLTTGYRERILSFDVLLRIGDCYQPYGYQGASLGFPLAVMIVSHLIRAPLDQHTALTGEIDVQGNILRVEGIAQKIRIARTCGVRRIIIPAENMPDASEPAAHKMQIVGVRTLEEACDLLFHDLLIEKGYRAFPLAAASSTASPGTDNIHPLQPPVPLIGRTKEILWLQQHMNKALSGHGNLTAIAGEAGTGKTRLLESVQNYARDSGMHVLCVYCYFQQGSAPYLPFIEPLSSLILQDDHQQLSDWQTHIAQLHNLMTRLEEHPSDPVSSAARQIQLFEHIMALLRLLMDGPGVLLCIEDLQWSDSGSLQLLHHLARQLAGQRICVLVTYRTEAYHAEETPNSAFTDTLQRLSEEGPGETLTLGNLSAPETRKLVEAALGSRAVSVWLSDRVYAETDGNPLYILEILKWWKETGVIGERMSERTLFDRENLSVPPRIYNPILHRLNRLQENDREVLEVAAVGGERFDVDDVILCLDMDRRTALRQIQQLERRHGLISHVEGRIYRFAHGKIQEVLYRELSPALRQSYHTTWGQALCAREQAGEDVPVEVLATHLYKGGDKQQAIPYLKRAAEGAQQMCAFREARKYWEQVDTALTQQDVSDTEEMQIEVDLRLGWVYYELGDLDAARNRYQKAFGAAKQRGDEQAQAEALMYLGVILRHRNQWDGALKLFEQSLKLYTRHNDQPMIAFVRTHMGNIAYWHGQWATARQYYQTALEIMISLDDIFQIAAITGNLGSVALAEGEDQTAIQYYERSAQGHRQTGNIMGIALVDMNMGMVYERMEQWPDALSRHRESVELFERMGHISHLWNAYLNYARVLARTGDLDLAEELCQKAKDILADIGNQRGIAEANRVDGLIATQRNDWDSALRLFEESKQLCQENKDPLGYGETLQEHGLMLFRQGNMDQAIAVLRQAAQTFREIGAHGDVAIAQRKLDEIRQSNIPSG